MAPEDAGRRHRRGLRPRPPLPAPGEELHRHRDVSDNSMKKESAKRRGDDVRPEYDLARLKGGVRGKYYQRATAGTNLVLLEPDLARAFPDSSSVNRALRLLRDVARSSSGRSRTRAAGKSR